MKRKKINNDFKELFKWLKQFKGRILWYDFEQNKKDFGGKIYITYLIKNGIDYNIAEAEYEVKDFEGLKNTELKQYMVLFNNTSCFWEDYAIKFLKMHVEELKKEYKDIGLVKKMFFIKDKIDYLEYLISELENGYDIKDKK